jgi:hypothetical protein
LKTRATDTFGIGNMAAQVQQYKAAAPARAQLRDIEEE